MRHYEENFSVKVTSVECTSLTQLAYFANLWSLVRNVNYTTNFHEFISALFNWKCSSNQSANQSALQIKIGVSELFFYLSLRI